MKDSTFFPLTIISPQDNCIWYYVVHNRDISSNHVFIVSLHCCLVVVCFFDFFVCPISVTILLSVGEGKRHLSRACYVWKLHCLSSLVLVMTGTCKYYYYSHVIEEETEVPRIRVLLEATQVASIVISHHLLRYTTGLTASRQPIKTTPILLCIIL